MIHSILFRPDTGTIDHGGAELLDAWGHDHRSVIWVDLFDNEAEEEARFLAERFGLDPLAIQDAQRERHPPKIEAFNGITFMLFKALHGDATGLAFRTIQLALFVGDRFLVTRHSGPSPSIEQLSNELTPQDSPITKGADALALRLLRIMNERYLKLILALEPRLEQIEDEMIKEPRDELLAELINYKSDLKKYTRVFLYHVQVLAELKRQNFPAIRPDQSHVINDVYEQQERIDSLGRLYYDTASDLIDGYISVASHRLNNIMKILTIITAIFVPLSFLAGIYGMNFENMPELKSRAGYFVLLGIMGSIVFILLSVFRKKKWL
jgi:magnesium transporter